VTGGALRTVGTRVARHWHECYRLSIRLAARPPKAAARVPWSELDHFLRQENILELRSIRRPSRPAAGSGHGHTWSRPARHELSEPDMTAITMPGTARWLQTTGCGGLAGRENVGPWRSCDPGAGRRVQAPSAHSSRSWENVGFVPNHPRPAGRRPRPLRVSVGLVQGKPAGQPPHGPMKRVRQMQGFAGGLRVIDGRGEPAYASKRSGVPVNHELAADGHGRRRVGRDTGMAGSEAVRGGKTKEGSRPQRATGCTRPRQGSEGPSGTKPVSDELPVERHVPRNLACLPARRARSGREQQQATTISS